MNSLDRDNRELNVTGSEQRYKNPWTTISRPMNRFMDVDETDWQNQESKKQQLA